MRRDSISNFAVCFYGFFVQSTAGCFYKQRNRAVDHGNQSGYDNIFTAQCYGCMQFHLQRHLLKVDFHVQKLHFVLRQRKNLSENNRSSYTYSYSEKRSARMRPEQGIERWFLYFRKFSVVPSKSTCYNKNVNICNYSAGSIPRGN